jgi:hypothetical protein
MTDPKQKLEARIAQVNQHWKDQRPYELFKRLMVQPVIGEASCALADTIIAEPEPEPEPGATPIAGLETVARARAAYAGYTP